jgi:hypothetical protein
MAATFKKIFHEKPTLLVICFIVVATAAYRFLNFDAASLPAHPDSIAFCHKLLGDSISNTTVNTEAADFPSALRLPYEPNAAVSVLYAPAYLFGYALASLLHFPKDGLSLPFALSYEMYALCLLLFGFINTRKFLLRLFIESEVALALVFVFIGSYIFQSFASFALQPALAQFCCFSFILAGLPGFLARRSISQMCWLVLLSVLLAHANAACALLVIVLPLLPVFTDEKGNLSPLINKNNFITSAGLLVLSVAVSIPLILANGSFHGSTDRISIDLLIHVFLSYHKGIFLFSPILFVCLLGLGIQAVKLTRQALWAFAFVMTGIVFMVLFSDWWNVPSYAVPQLAVLFPLYCLGFIWMLHALKKLHQWTLVAYFLILIVFVYLNQFQIYQVKNGILNPLKLDKSYYVQSFLSLKPVEALNYDAMSKNGMSEADKLRFTKTTLFNRTFKPGEAFTLQELNECFYRLNADVEYGLNEKISLQPNQFKSGSLLEFTCSYRMSASACNTGPFWVADIESDSEHYGYASYFMASDASKRWNTLNACYVLPVIKKNNDKLNFYFWNNGKCFIDILKFEAAVYEPKDRFNKKELFLID